MAIIDDIRIHQDFGQEPKKEEPNTYTDKDGISYTLVGGGEHAPTMRSP